MDPEPSMDPVWTRFSLEAFILRWEEIIHSCRVQNQEQSAEYEVQSKTSRRKKCRNQKPSPSQCHLLVHLWTDVSTAAIPLCPLTAVRHYRCWISSSTPTSAVLLAFTWRFYHLKMWTLALNIHIDMIARLWRSVDLSVSEPKLEGPTCKWGLGYTGLETDWQPTVAREKLALSNWRVLALSIRQNSSQTATRAALKAFMRLHWSMIRMEAAGLSANTRCLAKAAYSLEANVRVSVCLSNPLTYLLPGQIWSQVFFGLKFLFGSRPLPIGWSPEMLFTAYVMSLQIASSVQVALGVVKLWRTMVLRHSGP